MIPHLSKNSSEIVEAVLAFTPEQFDEFISGLSDEAINYLDVILEKHKLLKGE